MAKGETNGAMADHVSRIDRAEDMGEGLSAADIAVAYKAALSDYIRGKTNRKSLDVLARVLAGALAARKQLLAEREHLTSQRCHQFYN